MISKKSIGLMVFVLGISGCAEMDTTLKNVNNTLAATNNTLAGITEQDVSKVTKPLPNKEAVANMQEAMPTINKTLSIIACAEKESVKTYVSYQNRAMRYATSDSDKQMVFLPIFAMKNHRSGCLNIERIDSYKQIAKNAFSFNALYVSPQSEESKSIQYKMLKEPSGEWLFQFRY